MPRTPNAPAADYRFFTVTYNRSTKSYECTTEASEFFGVRPNSVVTGNGMQAIFATLGMVIAGRVGPSKSAPRAALVAGLLEYLGSSQVVDTDSFANCPVLPL